jgi:hypothetical protein
MAQTSSLREPIRSKLAKRILVVDQDRPLKEREAE